MLNKPSFLAQAQIIPIDAAKNPLSKPKWLLKVFGSAHAQCSGTAFGKEGSDLPFATLCLKVGLCAALQVGSTTEKHAQQPLVRFIQTLKR
jgi:hypothetical protein